MNKDRVAGKAAIVTGAASGIGEVTAQVLAREGASVCVADVNADGGQQVVDKIKAGGGEAIFVRTDVGESAQVIEMFERTPKKPLAAWISSTTTQYGFATARRPNSTKRIGTGR